MAVVSPPLVATTTHLVLFAVSDAKLSRGGKFRRYSSSSSSNRATRLASVSYCFLRHHRHQQLLHIINNKDNDNNNALVFQKKPKRKAAAKEEGITSTSGDRKEAAAAAAAEEEFQVVTALKTKYNDIAIVDSSNSRILLLDSTYNVHSIINKGDMEGQKFTASYWDEFATLPAIVPDGPIAILGLGGGTCAHLMLDLWPSLKLEGWEIDQILIDKSREYFGLSDLEKRTQTGGFLAIHVGDALSPSVSVPGGYAGIVVDLFSEGKILPQLQEVTTWLELNNKLMTDGRIMVNCGGAHANTTESGDTITHHNSSNGGLWEQNSTIKALSTAFPGKLSWKRMGEGENYLALTGPFPDLDVWSAAVPQQLSLNVKEWRPCCHLHEGDP